MSAFFRTLCTTYNTEMTNPNTLELDKPEITSRKGEEKYWLNLETTSEKKARIFSLFIVHLYVFVCSLGISIIFTSVQPYLKRLTLLNDKEVKSNKKAVCCCDSTIISRN